MGSIVVKEVEASRFRQHSSLPHLSFACFANWRTWYLSGMESLHGLAMCQCSHALLTSILCSRLLALEERTGYPHVVLSFMI